MLPRSRAEDGAFREWLQTHTPDWTEADRHPGPRLGEPDTVYATCPAPTPSAEGYRIIWVHSTAKAARDAAARQTHIEAGLAAIEALADKLIGPRCRLRSKVTVHEAATAALTGAHAQRWVTFTVAEHTVKTYRQEHRGRPGPNTRYREITTIRYTITGDVDPYQVSYDAACDGCFPLVSNDRALADAEVLAAYRYQPNLERRHHLLKTVQDAVPVLLKSPARIEALFCAQFLALLLGALIEREIRTNMHRAATTKIPLYPELRGCSAPSTERILEIFAGINRHHLHHHGQHVQTFEPEPTPQQAQVLDLLGVPLATYTNINTDPPKITR